MSKAPRIDPIRNLMTRRRAQPEAAYSAEEVDELLNYYKQLQEKVARQDEQIESLQKSSRADPVTGLANRVTLQEEVERSLATAKRYGRSHALLKLMVNDFEGYNAMGAETAVAVLTHISRVIRQGIRSTDIAARSHGAEFYVILNELRALDNAQMRAQEIAKAVASTPCITPGHTLYVGVTVGACLFSMDDTAESVFANANAAMEAAQTALA
ncbi:MAG: GGDEF domain-containing protein [Pseudomonadaceae bacterium]|nr:GGDEF domain-containing protein [Pseudomonadaceae bacterium]